MEFGFEESQAVYRSGAQKARVWTESWVQRWMYCPNCGQQPISKLRGNAPVADFRCPDCTEIFELKSGQGRFGRSVVDGAYQTMIRRLLESTNPNLFLLNYDRERLTVTDVAVVPKHFFVRDVVKERRPLGPRARRAGWVGCSIRLDRIPSVGRITIVRDGQQEPKEAVLANWRRTLFLREGTSEARGWLIETIRCVEAIGRPTFGIDDVYAFEARLSSLYPQNRHVKEKLRQQLQVLRDRGFIEFLGGGQYRVTSVRDTAGRRF
jgi:type II restriction enzyme